MTQSARAAPEILFAPARANASFPNTALDYTDNTGPSMAQHGWAILDPRYDAVRAWMPGLDNAQYAQGGAGSTPGPYGWFGNGTMQIANFVPATLLGGTAASPTGAIYVNNQAPVANTALTLISATAGGVTVGQSITRADTGATVTGLLVIDGAPGTKSYGTAGDLTTRIYDPTTNSARNVTIITNADDTGGFYFVRGYDIYNYPITEKITGVNNTTAAGKKAFKYIQSITPTGTINSTAVSAGAGDVYGFALRSGTKSVATADHFESIIIYWNATLISANTGYIAADATSPATNITGDVRGTYAVQSASNATKKLIVWIRLDPDMLDLLGLCSVTQFADF